LPASALSAAAQPAPAPPVTSPADFQRLLDTLVAAGAPGAIGAVEDGGHTIRAVSGVGNLRTGQPPRPVQTFRAASQTKAFVATVVLQLVAEGRIGLDDPVSRYLPRLLADGDRITVRQLLNHTSGLFDPRSRSTRASRTSTTCAWRTGGHARWWPWPPTTGCCSSRAPPGPTPTPTTWSPGC